MSWLKIHVVFFQVPNDTSLPKRMWPLILTRGWPMMDMHWMPVQVQPVELVKMKKRVIQNQAATIQWKSITYLIDDVPPKTNDAPYLFSYHKEPKGKSTPTTNTCLWKSTFWWFCVITADTNAKNRWLALAGYPESHWTIVRNHISILIILFGP